jgi:beta-N-acetylhexosaminidase
VISADSTALEADFSIFRSLADQAKMGMTCHVIFDALDAAHPATISPTVISQTIRGRIGFQGLLMTDDLGMEALGGSLAERGARALAAGCDMLLHCSGFLRDPAEILAEMQIVAEVAGPLEGLALSRAAAVDIDRAASQDFDFDNAWARFAAMMSDQQAGV